MGKTYHRQPSNYDDEFSTKRSTKGAKHANNKKTGGMRTLNNYVEEDYDFDLDENPFEEDIEVEDEIFIKHIKQR